MKSTLLALMLFMFQGPQTQAPATIEGFVVRAGTSTPVIRARVDLRKEGGGPGSAQSATVDASGKFAFRNLQPGTYRLSASRDGYMQAQYGARVPGGQGTAITLQGGQGMKDIVLEMAPKGAISGRVYDRYGDPVTNASVQALRYAYQDGRRILIPADNARTNDLGEYRLFWLAPGPYIVSAIPLESPCADGCSLSIENLPVFFPGTTDASAATPIDLPAGVNFTGVDLAVGEARAVRVRGRVVNGLTGQPALGAAVMLVPRRGTVSTEIFQRALIQAGGAFEIRHIAPGSYDLVGTTSSGGSGRLAAHAPIEIGGADIDNVALVLEPQFSISGRITFDNVEAKAANANMNGVRVELRREPYTPELLITLPAVAEDGTFTLTGVTAGEYKIRVNLAGVKGYIKSARYGANDALNPPFRIDTPGGQLEIVVSPNAGSLDGTVFDGKQQPFVDATVVLIPDSPRRQRFDLYRAASSDASGRVHLDSIVPGDYRLFAWDDVPADAWQDPDFIRQYEDRGKPVRISEGAKENVEIKLVSRR